MRKTGSDLNPNRFPVFVASCTHEKHRGHVADPPTRAEQLPKCFAAQRYARRLERGTRGTGSFGYILRFHVPVGVLKFSRENHVGSSTVQQTLAVMDSLADSHENVKRRDLEGDAGHLV